MGKISGDDGCPIWLLCTATLNRIPPQHAGNPCLPACKSTIQTRGNRDSDSPQQRGYFIYPQTIVQKDNRQKRHTRTIRQTYYGVVSLRWITSEKLCKIKYNFIRLNQTC